MVNGNKKCTLMSLQVFEWKSEFQAIHSNHFSGLSGAPKKSNPTTR